MATVVQPEQFAANTWTEFVLPNIESWDSGYNLLIEISYTGAVASSAREGGGRARLFIIISYHFFFVVLFLTVMHLFFFYLLLFFFSVTFPEQRGGTYTVSTGDGSNRSLIQLT